MEQIYKKLTEEIKKYNKIILMAHKNIDLDAYGALLCLYEIIVSFDKEVYIVMNKKVNESVKKALQKLDYVNYIYNDIEVEEENLLIVVDTHKESLVENNEILIKIKDKIILDHHIKDVDYIKDTIISYIDANASSTVEIVTNYLKYLNKKVNPIIATIMLAGIEIDTNNFDIKTTDKTYETAAFLFKLGSDSALKKELLQQNKEEYLKRQELLKSAHMINKNMALCILGNDIYPKEDLAIIANDLLQFDDVEAGFAIGKIAKNIVGVSAKSVGSIDVEKIMKKLGGGGHLNNAATQLKDIDIKEVEEKLLLEVKEVL